VASSFLTELTGFDILEARCYRYRVLTEVEELGIMQKGRGKGFVGVRAK